uniref:Uncharacterized protein n=1 Tax=Arundo donax TaxID=35708 RepID=A0A0A8YFY7_ARUDO
MGHLLYKSYRQKDRFGSRYTTPHVPKVSFNHSSFGKTIVKNSKDEFKLEVIGTLLLLRRQCTASEPSSCILLGCSTKLQPGNSEATRCWALLASSG